MNEYLQLGFLALYNTINEMGYETLTAQGINIIPILAKVVCSSIYSSDLVKKQIILLSSDVHKPKTSTKKYV